MSAVLLLNPLLRNYKPHWEFRFWCSPTFSPSLTLNTQLLTLFSSRLMWQFTTHYLSPPTGRMCSCSSCVFVWAETFPQNRSKNYTFCIYCIFGWGPEHKVECHSTPASDSGRGCGLKIYIRIYIRLQNLHFRYIRSDSFHILFVHWI